MPLPDHLELIKFYSDLFDPFFTDDPQNLREGIQHVHTFLSLYQRALQMYQLRKSEFSLLDYDDQLLKTRDLLMRDDVRREVAESYPLILVDEYQDTDDLQYDIIKSLTLDYTASNRLIIVGDPKQSIYRFRNADIALFLRSRDEIARTSTPHIGVFAESFRMCEVPMAFINFFFRKIFPQRSHCEPTIEYTDLINGRCSDDPGSVCFLKYESAGNTGDAVNTDGENMSSASDEATMIARQIIELHNGTYQYGEPLRTAPSVPLEDICILVRKRKLLPIIEHTLTQYSIPFHTYQSSGFYNAQEIIDITNYLTFLVNNHNDISLLGVLRSPYFMISDVQIFRIAFWNQKNNTIRDASLWDRLQNYMLNEQTEKSEELQRAYRQLDENRRLAGRIRTNRLIDKIYKESFIFGTITLLPDAEQKKANLRKYAAIALEYDAKGLKGLYDFVSRVQFLAERDDSERPAEKNTEKGKVHLMTIHNAKGLEFDVVFLPFLQSLYNRTDSMDNIAMVKDIALHLKSKQTNSLTEFIKIHNMIAAIEEEKRIFYVAMTRTKDHLFLSASIRRKNDGGIAYLNGTYLQWIAELFGQELAATPTINEPLTFYNKDTKEHTTKNIAIPFRIRTDVPEQPLKLDGSDVIAEPAFADVHVRPLPKAEGKTRYSPTQLNIYRQCPTKYYLQYVLGLNEDTVLPLGFSDEDDSEVSKGTMLGSLVHAMLESLNIISNDGELLEQQFDEKLHKIAGKFGNNVDNIIAQYRESVMQHCRNFISSPFGKYAAAASEYFTELPMRMPVTENQSLSGIIDRLYRDDNGWHILDYKTDINLDRSEKYEFQLQCYAYMVSKLHKSERYHTHIFFTRTGVSVDSVYTAEDLERFGTEIRSVISAILADKKVSSLSHIVRNRTECKHCQFYLSEKDRCLADDQKPAVTPKR
jgi:ATP-dependent helicase/nuclease subunit A